MKSNTKVRVGAVMGSVMSKLFEAILTGMVLCGSWVSAAPVDILQQAGTRLTADVFNNMATFAAQKMADGNVTTFWLGANNIQHAAVFADQIYDVSSYTLVDPSGYPNTSCQLQYGTATDVRTGTIVAYPTENTFSISGKGGVLILNRKYNGFSGAAELKIMGTGTGALRIAPPTVLATSTAPTLGTRAGAADEDMNTRYLVNGAPWNLDLDLGATRTIGFVNLIRYYDFNNTVISSIRFSSNGTFGDGDDIVVTGVTFGGSVSLTDLSAKGYPLGITAQYVQINGNSGFYTGLHDLAFYGVPPPPPPKGTAVLIR